MRLQEVYSICRHAQAIWIEPSFSEVRGYANVMYYTLDNPNDIRAMLSFVEQVDTFKETITTIRGRSRAFALDEGDIIVDGRNKTALIADFQLLFEQIKTITNLFNSLEYRQDSDGFDIKLPPNMSLAELSKCTRDLDQIFSICPLFSNQSGTISFSAVDVGSVWLTFIVGGVAAVGILKLVAELVDKAIIIRSHQLSAKEQEERIRTLKLGNDVLEQSAAFYKNIGKELLNQTARDLAEEHDINNPEDFERLKNTIQLLSDWMTKGLEVHASIQAPPEVKAVFPPIEKQALPEAFTALLTDGNNISE